MGKEGYCRPVSLACVGRTHRVPATLSLPPRTVCVLSLSIMIRLQVSLQGAGPELHALPRPKPFRFRFLGTPQRRGLSWTCVLCLSHLSSSGNQELEEHTGTWGAHSPQVQCSLFPPRSQPQFPGMQFGCALCLFCRAYFWLQPSQQMSTIQNLRKPLVRNWKQVW